MQWRETEQEDPDNICHAEMLARRVVVSLFEHIAVALCQIRLQVTSTSPLTVIWLATTLFVDAGPPVATVYRTKMFCRCSCVPCQSTIKSLPDGEAEQAHAGLSLAMLSDEQASTEWSHYPSDKESTLRSLRDSFLDLVRRSTPTPGDAAQDASTT